MTAKEMFEESIDNSKQYAKILKEKLQLESNWKELKKWLEEIRQTSFDINGILGECTEISIDFLLDKMRELEGKNEN